MKLPAFLGLIIGSATLAAEPSSSFDTNWHQWRGPLATGVGPKANPPVSWDAKAHVRWQVELPGKSSATPIVWGDRVFTITSVSTDRVAKLEDIIRVDAKFDRKTEPPGHYQEFHVYCFERDTGKQLWTHKAAVKVPHEGHHPTHSYAAGSPTTDGQRLYVSFGSFGIFCYALDGKLLWSRDLGRLVSRLGWGEAVTPVVHGDALLLNWDQEADSKLICLDAKTGKTRWEAPRDEKTSWNTPLVMEHKGTTQVIVNGTTRVRSYDLANGEPIWTCAGMTVNAIPSAVPGDGVVYVLSGYRGAAGVAISLDAKGEVADTPNQIWKISKGTPYVPSPLLTGGRLYFTSGNANLLTVLEAKIGKPLVAQERLPVISFYASPVAAAGRVYFTAQDGTTLVYKEGDKLDLLATNKLNDPVDASPALAGKQIFLRSHRRLYCLE